MSTCLLIHLLDELVFVVVLLGIAEGGTDAAGDLDGEPVAVPVVALPVVPVDHVGALAVGHGETGGGGPGAGTGAANGDNLAAAAEAKVHAEAVVSVQSGGGDGAAALDGLLGLARAHGDVKAVAVLIAADPAVPCERGVYAEQR